jgi:adenylate cyclase
VKKNLPRILFGMLCVLLFLGHAGKIWHLPFVTALDAYFYDVRVRMFMPNTVDERVVVVDIDEKSLAEIGRWPWSRDDVAEMVRRMTDDYKVSVIGFDVVFAEPDESSGLKVLEEIGRTRLRNEAGYQRALQSLRGSLDYDRLFADTLRGRPVVMGFYFSNQTEAKQGGELPPPVFTSEAFQGRAGQFVSWRGFGANLPAFQQAALSGGHFNPLVDFDGNTRRVPLLVEFQGNYYEALSLAVVRALLGQAELRPGYPDPNTAMEWIDVVTARGSLRIPVDGEVAALVPYRGFEKSFRYLSAADVLMGRVDPEALLGRIVLVGTSAPGLNDLRATPVGGTYPGVEVHANLIAGMLDGSIKQKPSYIIGVDILILLFLGGLLSVLLPKLSPVRGTLLTLAALLGTLAFNAALWNAANLVLPVASGVVLILLIYGYNMAWGFFIESRVKRQFTELFGQYVPPELVDEMARNPESYSMEGRNEELTVLFSDVRGFTTISESLNPKELTQLMNEYLGSMTEVVRQNRGTLDKYIGDAIMAFWGAPVSDPNHAQHAVLTALSMQEELKKLADPFRARGWPELHIGVGVNTGTMTVGDMGSPVRKSYTVMGDAVNLGSRLEGITKEYGVGIIAGEGTRAATQGIVYRELDKVRVKGKDEPITIYEPLGLEGALPGAVLDELERWHHALRLYRDQQWDTAEVQLINLANAAPHCYLYKLYLERIAMMRNDPPGAGWDGVTTFKTK